MKKTIDPTQYPTDHPLSKALRLVSRYWFLCFSRLMALRWEETTACPFGMTDGRTLWLNPAGVSKLAAMPDGTNLLAFLLVHEALHALLGHGWRAAPLPNKDAANQAADYIVNALVDLRNKELGKQVFPVPDFALLDHSISADLSLEKLYRQLAAPKPQDPNTNEKQDQPNKPEEPSEGDPSNGDQNPDAGEAAPPDDTGSGSGESGGDPSNELPSGGSGDDSPDPSSDMGSPSDGSGSGVDSPEPDPLAGFVGGGQPDNIAPQTEAGETQAEVTDAIEESNEKILIANELDSKTSGDTGQTGRRAATQRVDATKLDWTDLTREWVQRRTRNGWDSPFNQAIHGATGLVCAGRRRKSAGEIVLVLDTSGSIGAATYAKFLQQGQAILDELKPERLILLSVSHIVADAVELAAGDVVPTTLKGGGGTRFQPAFDWLAERDIEPEFMLYLTDGYSYDLSTLKPVSYPLLWLSTAVSADRYPIGDVLEITNL